MNIDVHLIYSLYSRARTCTGSTVANIFKETLQIFLHTKIIIHNAIRQFGKPNKWRHKRITVSSYLDRRPKKKKKLFRPIWFVQLHRLGVR